MVGGFAALIIFALYEHYGNPKQPLTPTHSGHTLQLIIMHRLIRYSLYQG